MTKLSYRVLLLGAFGLAAASLAKADDSSVGKPLKVFILAGQSNMQGHAEVRTFDAMRLNPEASQLLADMRQSDGSPTVCDQVWIASMGSASDERTGRLTVGFGAEGRGPKIGPEFTFGIYMERLLNEPILIIKTAWGGKSLHTDFRPPSAGPYIFDETQLGQLEKQGKNLQQIRDEKVAATGLYYRMMIDYVKGILGNIDRVYPGYDRSAGYEISGFVWFQGWNDMVDGSVYPMRDQPGGYDQYSDCLAHFIRDVRKDLDADDLPFVIGVMGVGGPTSKYGEDQKRYRAIHQHFRDAMAAPAKSPEFRENVVAVLTENFWDMELEALRQRERKLQQRKDEIIRKIKSGQLSQSEGDAQQAKLYTDHFDERELEILKESVSNAEYHYLGSASIMAQIGKAFAEGIGRIIKP